MKICALQHRMWHPRRAVSPTRVIGRHALDLPRKWPDPSHVFVMPQGDLFLEPDGFVVDVFREMVINARHEFQVTTRNVARVLELAPKLPWPENVWLGALFSDTVDEQELARLRSTPAHVRYVHLRSMNPASFDPRGINFVIVETPYVEAPEDLEKACEAVGARLFVGASVADAELRTRTTALAPMPRDVRRR